MSLFDEIQDAPFFSLSGLECDAKIVNCHDGDTVQALIPLNGSIYKWKCRLSDIDTPEIRTHDKSEKERGLHARDVLSDLILNRVVRVKCGIFEKYGRLLVHIYIPDSNGDGQICLNDWMVDNGYAHRYNGGTKEKWIN